jgi:hypothetical protein
VSRMLHCSNTIGHAGINTYSAEWSSWKNKVKSRPRTKSWAILTFEIQARKTEKMIWDLRENRKRTVSQKPM